MNTIKDLVKHVFGDQYEMGLDYIQLLLNKPEQKLPVVSLYSPEDAPAKNMFASLLMGLLKDDAILISNEDLQSNFGIHRFVDKLLAICDEPQLNENNSVERIKLLATAELPIMVNSKGRSVYEQKTDVKFLFMSNVNVFNSSRRFWAIRVPQQKKKDQFLMAKMRLEIPAFIEYLKNRKISTKQMGRMWFDHNLFQQSTNKQMNTSTDKLTPEEIKELELKIESNLISSLEDFLEAAKINFSNLHELLGVTKHTFTRLKNSPRLGTLDLCKKIAKLSGVRATVLVNSLKFGQKRITVDELVKLDFEEKMFGKKSA